MIVCHCNVIRRAEIEGAVRALLAEGGVSLVTPGAVFRALASRPRCPGCMPQVSEIVYGIQRVLGEAEAAAREARWARRQKQLPAPAPRRAPAMKEAADQDQ